VGIAQELGYLKIPENTLVDIDEAAKLPKHKVVILTTGSQGEPMSALTRIASAEHRKVVLSQGDTVIISASPIPGNEKLVARIIDQLFKLGAEVIYESLLGIHVSGHASQEELKFMLTLIKPKYFIPVHGEYRMLVKHSKLAQSLGMSNKNIFVAENGQVIEITKRKASLGGRVTAGRVLVDGRGVGDVGSVVLRDRKQLSQDGIMIVMLSVEKETGQVLSGPEVVSRGFVYVKESEKLLEEARAHAVNTLNRFSLENYSEWSSLKNTLRDSLGKFLYEKTRRRPIILPIIMEI
jgi:ribonuclease J